MLFASLIFLLHINIEYLLLNIMEAERKKLTEGLIKCLLPSCILTI